MSGQATGWVLKHGPRPDDLDRNGKRYGGRARGLRAVMVTVADAANAEGEHAHPGIGNVCAGSLYGRRQAWALLTELVEERWLEVEQAGGGKGKATVYRLVRMVESNRALAATNGNRALSDDEPRTLAGDTAHSEAIPRTPGPRANGLVTETPNGLDQRAATLDLDIVDPFDAWWERWPDKRSKPAARAAYARARTKAPDAVLLAGAERFAADPNRCAANTPHASTWLNNERWDDPPLLARNVRPTTAAAKADWNAEQREKFVNTQRAKEITE